jgi:hypothetical protein
MDYKFHTQSKFNKRQFQVPKDNVDIGKFGPFTKESMNQVIIKFMLENVFEIRQSS